MACAFFAAEVLGNSKDYWLEFFLIASVLFFSCMSTDNFCSFAASVVCPSSRNALPST